MAVHRNPPPCMHHYYAMFIFEGNPRRWQPTGFLYCIHCNTVIERRKHEKGNEQTKTKDV
jgi:hypothetical protein